MNGIYFNCCCKINSAYEEHFEFYLEHLNTTAMQAFNFHRAAFPIFALNRNVVT